MEKLRLMPTEHWQKDKLTGISIHVKDKDGGFVGCFTMKPIDL